MNGKGLLVSQQVQRIDSDRRRQPLDGTECEIAFAAFDAAHVRTVYPDDVREVLLAEAALFTVAAQVATKGLLQVAFHVFEGFVVLLEGLHTYE